MLGVVQHDRSGRIEVWADQVRRSLPETDVQRLHALSDVRKDQAVWEHQRRFECDKREYLTEDVLRSTGTALVWWLSLVATIGAALGLIAGVLHLVTTPLTIANAFNTTGEVLANIPYSYTIR